MLFIIGLLIGFSIGMLAGAIIGLSGWFTK